MSADVAAPRFEIVGRTRIVTGAGVTGDEVLGGRRGRLVLAYLMVERHRPVDREELATVLWSDALPACLLYTSPSPRDGLLSRMPSSA